MGKRGPNPKGEYAGKSGVLSTRIRPDTRANLVDAARSSGRSLSQEIEYRLRRGFENDEKIKGWFGTRRNYRLMQMVAGCAELAIDPEKPDFDVDWLDDPTRFEITRRMIMRMLEAFRPAGPVPKLSVYAELGIESQPAFLISRLQNADSSLPLGVSDQQHMDNATKADLGDVAFRPKIVAGNSEDFRPSAEDAERDTTNVVATTKPSASRSKRKQK